MTRLGEYRLGPILGAGGMATVSSAHHRVLELPAAVKIMGRVDDPAFERAFFAEARAHAGLEHPNIVRILDFGQVSSADEPPADIDLGRPYLVMERADGSLRDLMPLNEWPDVVAVLSQVLDALSYSHARGVVHRDLKPENVLYFETTEGRVFKLSDFGIAAPLHVETHADRDTLRTAAGTPPYMPPEQLRGAATEIGPWTDLYALGCIAWELVTGAPPFLGDTPLATAIKHMQEPLPAEVRMHASTPARFEAWMRRLLMKSPRDRARFAADAAAALATIEANGGPRETTETAESRPVDDLDAKTTIVDFDELSLSDTMGFEPIALDVHDASAEGMHIPPAPVPLTWHAQIQRREQAFWGLGLLPLRRVPLPGLDAERDRLWEMLRGTWDRKPSLALLRGSRDAPVEWLAEWLCTRARETGAAHVISTRHSAEGGPNEGLTGIISDVFGLNRVEPARYHEVTASQLSDADDPRADVDAAMLANEVLIARGAPTRGRVAASVTELQEAIIRALNRVVSDRPLILRLDSVEHGVESLSLVDLLLEADEIRWMLLATTHQGFDGGPFEAAWTELDQGNAELIQVRGFSESELQKIAASLVPLTRASAQALSTRAPDPIVISAVLAELVDLDGLELSGTRFSVARTGPLEAEPEEIFSARLRRALLGLDAHDARLATALAAQLGDAPDRGELVAVCAHLGVDVPRLLEASLARFGLIRTHEAGWQIVHPAAREAMLRVAPTSAEACHRAIAETFEARDAHPRPAHRLRLAAHWRHADPERAWDHYVAAHEDIARRDPDAGQSILRALQDLASHFPEDTEKSLLLALLHEEQTMAEGSPVDLEALDLLQTRSENAGFDRGVAMASQLRARIRLYASDFDAALSEFARAANAFHALGLNTLEANAAFGLGFVAYRRADFEVCQASYVRAAELFGAAGNEEREASVLLYLAAAYMLQDRFEDAAEVTARALNIAKRLQSWALIAEASSDAADAARYRGDYPTARERYEESGYWRRISNSREAPLAVFNLALVDIGEGRWADARSRLDEVEAAYGEMGASDRLSGVIDAARALTLMGQNELEEGIRRFDDAARLGHDVIDRDFAWLAERAAELVNAEDDRRHLRSLAEAHYRKLGLLERANAMRG